MDDASDVDVRDNREVGRYEVNGLDTSATLDYQPECRLVIAQVHVPESLDEPGHRVGGQLLRAAIARARADHLTLVPSCPFARRWLRDNPEAWAGVAIDWPADVDLQRSASGLHPAPPVFEPWSTKRAVSWDVDRGRSTVGDRLEVSVTYSQVCPRCGDVPA